MAGTNGKGSVCALLASALQAAGCRVGLSTSPHLVTVRERIRLNGLPIPKVAFTRLVNRIRRSAAPLFAPESPACPTYFEFITALSCLYFQEEQVDAAVLEVGLGGRLDSTNVVTPAVSVITSIDLDHTHILGSTLAAIAAEKAGIIKPGIPVVVGEHKPEAVERIEAIAAERNAPVFLRGREFDALSYEIASRPDGAWQQRNRVRWGRDETDLISGIVGRHQRLNVAVACAVLHVLRDRGWDFDLGRALAGFAVTRWPARLQVLPDGLIVDAAHNPAGMAESVHSLIQLCPDTMFNILCAFLADKQWRESLEYLAPIAASIRIAPIDNPRSEKPAAIRRYVRERWPDLPVKTVRSAENGRRQVLEAGNALVIGSIYFAGEILAKYPHATDM